MLPEKLEPKDIINLSAAEDIEQLCREHNAHDDLVDALERIRAFAKLACKKTPKDIIKNAAFRDTTWSNSSHILTDKFCEVFGKTILVILDKPAQAKKER